MNFKISNRQFLSAAIIVFYLIPLLFFSIYSIRLMSQHKSWTLLTLGLLLIVIGSLSLIFLLSYWEQSVRDRHHYQPFDMSQPLQTLSPTTKETKVTLLDPSLSFEPPIQHEAREKFEQREDDGMQNLLQAALEENKKEQEALFKLLEDKELEKRKQEDEAKIYQNKAQQVAQDFADYKLFSEEQLKQKQIQLATLQQIIEDQRSEMEKRQDQIHQLDTKVHDLSYEIKTLLYLHEEESMPIKKSPSLAREEKRSVLNPSAFIEDSGEQTANEETPFPPLLETGEHGNIIQTPGEALQLLKKCVLIAQKLTGANYRDNESSRYRTFTSSYFAIDQRRLFDSLRNEKGALIMVYSPNENKPLFANNESKTLLGWSSEKFVSDFPLIMQEGMQEWKKALQLLHGASESQARLLVKSKQGQEVIMNCHLGTIPNGLFRQHVIAILYPA